ncbi:MAG TPA: aconitate hydratase AcnA [Fimbriimonadaceae bacterium]|nr:aconitate hydratase AcnA [Fimbriimonadaceae bacterium]HRJ32741.1 aconitate hydratase AcnA [Fimbriimonadaceae bacterium]
MDSFGAKTTFSAAGQSATIYRLQALADAGHSLDRLPYSMKILLENLVRAEDGKNVTKKDIEAVLQWNPQAEPSQEIQFSPARVLLQDFTGVPCVVDLAAMRDAMARLGGDPNKINPLQPVELVIDHSVQVDVYGTAAAATINLDLEFERNQERYEFLKWGQKALDNFKVVPPNTGICHQVNLEYLARVVFRNEKTGEAYPDTLVGTDSHTTMINGLGVLGWGVGGIEAEAAMLGQPVSMLLPQVVGFKLTGKLPEGATATDLVLTVTEMLRKHGVVGKFVEFYGPGLADLPLADRATIANMAPEYGATCGIFPVDEETLRYLRISGRDENHIAFVEAYMREQGLFHDALTPEAEFSSHLQLNLGEVVPSVAGPKRPQDRVVLGEATKSFTSTFESALAAKRESTGGTAVLDRVATDQLTDGSIVIAAITSCTNTSNPSVMVAAGLVAQKAVARGLKPKPWVKTSLAPGSKVVTEYLQASGLLDELDKIGFNVVGYGCTTCIGNSGPLPEEVSQAIQKDDLIAVSVLSGNRNFEGRVNAEVKANYLMSPPLVVAYAFAGSIYVDLTRDPLGHDPEGNPVYLKDIWPSPAEVQAVIEKNITRAMFTRTYADVFTGDAQWQKIEVDESERYAWDPQSTYVKEPPYFQGMTANAPDEVSDPSGLRVLAILADSITTDHISPAGSIKANGPAGSYLSENGVKPHLFNSYGSRRGNHEVMMRGTFANIRLRNLLAPGTEGGWTTYLPTGEVTSIYDAAMRYTADGVGTVVLAGKEYGSGSSRDWAAKGPALLGVKVVIAESFERIHRSNLVGMGVLPLQFLPGENVASLGLTGQETFGVAGIREGIATGFSSGKRVQVTATRPDGTTLNFEAIARIDTPAECAYYLNGGILPYVLRQLLKG